MKKRKEIAEKYKWDLSDLCSSEQDFYNKLESVKRFVAKFEEFKGKLNDEKELLKYFKLSEKFASEFDKIYLYACCHGDEDTVNTKANECLEKLEFFESELSEKTAFISIEMNEFSNKYIDRLLKDPRFKNYDRFLSEQKRAKKHKLKPDVEEFLAGASFLGGFSEVHRKFDDADLKFDDILDSKGKKHKLTDSDYKKYVRSGDRILRKNAMEETFKKYGENINFLSANYINNIKETCFFSRKRKYSSSLAAALEGEELNEKVYYNLISSVRNNLNILFDYYNKKKKLLGVKDFAVFDTLSSISSGKEKKYSFEEGIEILKKALAPLGEEYVNTLDKAFLERWIDAMPNDNKRSGAYENACYFAHPYILCNFNGTVDEISTIAHEFGHAMHSFYSNRTQPFAKAFPGIFLAEIASTTNEIIFASYLIENAKDNKEKIGRICALLDNIKSTVYRQAMFSEFEEKAHSMYEKGEPLTKDGLCEMYYQLNKEYFGKGVRLINSLRYEWARIPHFYRDFYVYKYANGMLCAINFANRILSGEEGALQKYIGFLSAGDSKPPLETLKKAGCDIEEPKTYEKSFEFLRKLVHKLDV